MLKRILSVITAIACLCSLCCISVSASDVIINGLTKSEGWESAGTFAGDVIVIAPNAANAQGRIAHFDKLDETASWSGTTNSATQTAMKSNRIIIKNKMSMSSVSVDGTMSAGVTHQLNLVSDKNGYIASTYLVMLKSNNDDTFNVFVNTDTNGTTEPSYCVKSNVEKNTFVSVMADMYYDADQGGWNITYYIDGKKAGNVIMTSNTPTSATGIRLRLSNDSAVSTNAKNTEFSMIAYPLAEEFPEFSVVSSEASENAVTLNFSTEISDEILSFVTVNGTSWEHCVIADDQKSIKLTNLPLEAVSVAIDGAKDIFGTVINSYEETFDLTPVEDVYIPPVFYRWIAYENFSNWDKTYTNWSAGLSTTTPDSSVGTVVTENGNSSLKMLSKGVASGMNRINSHAKNDVLTLLNSADTEYTILIKSRVCPTQYGASSTSNEISLASGVSTKQRLFEMTTTSTGVIQPKIHGADTLSAVSLNQWVELVITAKVSKGVATFSYNIDGNSYESGYKYDLVANGINAIQFAQRGFAEGKFDDIEVYLFTGDAPSFSFVSFDAQNGGNLSKLDTNKAVQLNVSSEITKKSLIKEGTASIFYLNGVNVPISRVKTGEDFKSVVILPDGEWDPLTTYNLTIDDTLFYDIFDTVFTAYETPISFTTGGWLVSANNGAFSKQDLSNGLLEVKFDVKNMSSNSVNVRILLAKCIGTRDKYMMMSCAEKEYLVSQNTQEPNLSAQLDVTDAESGFVMAFVYNGENSRPLIKEPLILE